MFTNVGLACTCFFLETVGRLKLCLGARALSGIRSALQLRPRRRCLDSQAEAMFGTWNWADFGSPGGAVAAPVPARPERSRSPPAGGPGRVGEAAPRPGSRESLIAAAAAVAPVPPPEPWSTGNVTCDDWLVKSITDKELLANFAEIPQRVRKSIVLKALTSPKDNPTSWIAACLQNHRTREMEKRLASMASPMQNSAPAHTTPQNSWNGAPMMTSSTGSCASRFASSVSGASGGSAPNHGSIVVTGTNLLRDSHDASEVAAWRARTWAAGKDSKSALLRAVHATLSGETLQSFQGLPPSLQASWASLWVFAVPSFGAEANEVMQAWLQRYQSLGPEPPISTPVVSPVPCDNKRNVQVQPILIGCNAAFQFNLIEAAFKLMLLRGAVTFALLPVLSTFADESTTAVVQQLASAGSTLAVNETMSPEELLNKVGASVNQWQRENVKVVILTSVPMTCAEDISGGDAEAVLHSPQARHVWSGNCLSGRVMSVVGQSNVLDMVVLPKKLATDVDRTFLEKKFGPMVPCAAQTPTPQSGRDVVVCSNVKISTNNSETIRAVNLAGPIDEWQWKAGMASVPSAAPGTMFRTLPSLLVTEMFGERPLSMEERHVIATGTMVHTVTQEKRFVSRAFHDRWLGIEGTPLAKALQAARPCKSWILGVTGDGCENKAIGEACGAKRYCLTCEEIFASTCCCAPFNDVYPQVLCALDVAMTHWSSGTSDVWIQREFTEPPHNCGAACPRNPCPGK